MTNLESCIFTKPFSGKNKNLNFSLLSSGEKFGVAEGAAVNITMLGWQEQ